MSRFSALACAAILLACIFAVAHCVCIQKPNVPLAWSAEFTVAEPNNQYSSGRMWNDFDNGFQRTDLTSANSKVSQVIRNFTMITAVSGEMCMTQQISEFWEPFWWTSFSDFSGFDSEYQCNQFTFAGPLTEVIGCFATPQTPVYVLTKALPNGSWDLFIHIANWLNGPQDPSVFGTPSGCYPNNMVKIPVVAKHIPAHASNATTIPSLRAVNALSRLFNTPKK